MAIGEFEPQEGPPTEYRCTWSFGDGETEDVPCEPSTPISTEHGYEEAGTYVVRLRVQSAADRFGEVAARVAAGAP